jgi:hypothetical protein
VDATCFKCFVIKLSQVPRWFFNFVSMWEKREKLIIVEDDSSISPSYMVGMPRMSSV